MLLVSFIQFLDLERNVLSRDANFEALRVFWPVHFSPSATRLRHAHATLLDAVGTPLGTVQALLGHSSSEITRETYIHSVPADARRAVGDVEKLFGPKWTQVPIQPGLEVR
jgi:integrase